MKSFVKTGMKFSDYRADDINRGDTWETAKGKSISKSLICSFIDDPWAWKNAPTKKDTTAMKAGSLLDCLLTDPGTFHDRYIITKYENFKTTASKQWRKDVEATGKVVLTNDQYQSAVAQRKAIISNPIAAELLHNTEYQVAFRHETKHPFGCKGMIDILPNDGETIIDLKTCQASALESPRSLARHIYEWKYHVQAGAYIDGYSIASGCERSRFKFIFVSSSAPYRVAVVEIPFRAIALGGDIYRRGVSRFAECLENNSWPSVWDGEVEIDLPEYAYSE